MTVYPLWNPHRSEWCADEVVGEKSYGATIHRLLPSDWSPNGTEVRRTFELIPEPANPHDSWAISVRADGHTVGYLPRETCQAWANVVRRVIASGYLPVVPGRVYAFDAVDWDKWEGIGDPPKDFAAKIQLKLGDPHTALPINDPPSAAYTLIPRSAIVQVTKEDEHSAALLKFVPASGYGLLFVTLHECVSGRGPSTKPVVEVRIDDERIGQLTPQMSQRFLPMIRHLQSRGLVTACWGDITGSAVAAEVRIDGIKANEADSTILDGEPMTVPKLVTAQEDPLDYDLSMGTTGHVEPAARYSYEPAMPTQNPVTRVPPPLPPAAWYEDPSDPRMFRYWDGARWTQHVAPKVT